MTEATTIYSTELHTLTADQVERLAMEGAEVSAGPSGEVVVDWPEVRISLHPMAADELDSHRSGFGNYVLNCAGGDEESIAPLLQMIANVETVIGCVVEPDFDIEQKVKSLIVSLACTYEGFLFYEGNIYSSFGEIWFGDAEGTDYADVRQLTVKKTVTISADDLTERQQQRTERVQNILATRNVPTYSGPIRWMADDDDFELRTPQEVARRVLAMHAVVCLAFGQDRDSVLQQIRAAGVMDALSPKELAFLKLPSLTEEDCQPVGWRVECVWVLLWAMRYFDKFTWPKQCDVDRVHKLVFKAVKQPQKFISGAQLRSKRSILDATELIVRMHWAIRQSYMDEEEIPENLNWLKPSRMVPVKMSPHIGVVAERHWALNWLIRFADADWDDVDTPT